MARTPKASLSYFPFNVDFFSDDKIMLVAARFGVKGEIIAVKLLCKIYSTNGYYYQWGEDESLLFAKTVGEGITHALVNDVVNELAKRGFFNESILSRFKILTSTGIQDRYITICKQLKRTVEIKPEYNCTKLKMLRDALSPELSDKTPELLSKIQEESTQRKGKENKGKENEEEAPPPSEFLKRLFSDLGDADRENICIQIRKHAINPQWAVQFNAHLHTQSKVHPNYERWLSHFTAWLRTRTAELAAESTVNAIQKNKTVWK